MDDAPTFEGGAMDTSESLLRAILATVARQTFPPSEVLKIVCPTKGADKQLLAYNLCDRQTPQSEIRKKVKFDSGNFSRTIARWCEAGVVVRIGPDQHPIHLYPLSDETIRASQKGRNADA
jgi:hypothetical protein